MDSNCELKLALKTDIALYLRSLTNLDVYVIGTCEVPGLTLDEEDYAHEGVIVVERKGKPDSRVFVRVDYELF